MFDELRPLSEEQVNAHVENIARDGYSVMHDAIPQKLQQALLDEMDRLQTVRPGGDFPKTEFIGQVTLRWADLLNDGDVWQTPPTHPWVKQVLDRVLGEGFLLSSLTTIVIGPGEPAQAIHCDDGIYGFARPHPELACNTMWALTDFTDEIGATRVVPGSNNRPDDPVYGASYDSIPLEMPAGSIGFIVGSCWHGGGANRTNRDRPAVAMNYCSGVMRQQENLMLAVRPERMMTFSPELQDLIGFKMGRMAGFIFGGDPRIEMQRRYPDADAKDPYLERRNSYHHERTTVENPYV